MLPGYCCIIGQLRLHAIRDWERVDNNSQFPAGSEWLKDNVSMNFPIDTLPSSYVWSALRTLEWLSQVLESHIQLNAIVTFCCERHLRVSHVFSCLFRQVYINQCKFHIISSSHSTCTACTTTYYRFFNIWNKLLKCTYIHLSLFHSNQSNIQQPPYC